MLVLGAALGLLAVLVAAVPPATRTPAQRGQRTARRREAPALELILDLAASLLQSGLPIARVLDILGSRIPHCAPLRTVARCLELNMDWEQAWQGSPAWLEPLQRALRFSHNSGAGAAPLLRNLAQLQRREHAKRAQEVGAQFGTKLVLPLGLCALPAFIALGVVPIIIALLPNW